MFQKKSNDQTDAVEGKRSLANQYATVVEIVLDTLNSEMEKLDMVMRITIEPATAPKGVVVSTFLYDLYLVKDIHTMFLHDKLKELTETIFNDEVIRDFVLRVTQRCGILINTHEIKHEAMSTLLTDGFFQTVVGGQSKAGVFSLMPEKVHDYLMLDKHELFCLLRDNYWLFTLLVIKLHFEESKMYKSAREELDATLPSVFAKKN
jgi:hypothetical protein